MRPSGFVLAMTFLAASAAAVPELPVTPEAFATATTQAKREALSQIARHALELPPGDVVAVLKAGLLDVDLDVRRQALNAVASHAAGQLFLTPEPPPSRRSRGVTPPADPPALQDRVRRAWLNERPLMSDLRPSVLATLADLDPGLRRNAVFALVCLDFDGGQGEPALREQTIADLAAAFRRERAGSVRAEIVKSLALTPQDTPELRQLVLQALDDPHGDVRRHALVGVERLPVEAALPKVLAALRDPDAYIRFLAARALANFPASLEMQRALEDAQAVETDPAAKGEIERSLLKARAGLR
jgi:hypothetical protein